MRAPPSCRYSRKHVFASARAIASLGSPSSPTPSLTTDSRALMMTSPRANSRQGFPISAPDQRRGFPKAAVSGCGFPVMTDLGHGLQVVPGVEQVLVAVVRRPVIDDR